MFHNAKEVNRCLAEIKKGDLSQIEPLYNVTAMHLLCVARSYLNNKALAHDVVSEVFIKVLLYCKSYDGNRDGYNWLCKITQNLANDFNEKEKKVACSEQQFAQKLEDSDCGHAFDETDFRFLVDDLDQTDQFIAYKRFAECRTLEEIGKELKLSRTAIFLRVRKICAIIDKNNTQQ